MTPINRNSVQFSSVQFISGLTIAVARGLEVPGEGGDAIGNGNKCGTLLCVCFVDTGPGVGGGGKMKKISMKNIGVKVLITNDK